jgi:SynChlorMet cassette radical SAM/SPASM protein ScmE
MAVTSSGALIANPAAVLREAADGWTVLADPEAGRWIALNDTALAAWRAIDGRRGLADVVGAVLAGYDDPPQDAGRGVAAVLERFLDEGFAAVERARDQAAGALAPEAGETVDALPRFGGVAPGPLRAVEIAVTARCNARCLYCYHFDNPNVRYEDLPTAEWLAFFAELGRLGVQDVTLAGGEPLMREDIVELVDGVVAAGLRFTVLSNGALLTDELAAHLAGTGRCDGVQISVDGSRAEVHDAARGEGSFEGAVRALRILKRHEIRPSARVTVHRHNVDDLEATAVLLLDELGLPAIGTNAAGPMGSCALNEDGLRLTVAERERAMRTLVGLAARYPGRVQAAAGPLADARMWARMEAARREEAPPFDGGGRLTGCGCAWSKLAALADGSIVVCPMLPHLVLGRVGYDDVAELWCSHPVLQRHRGRRERPLAAFAHCESCTYQAYCTGNCPGPAFTLTGQVDAPAPDACLRDYLAAGGRMVEGADDGV